MIKDISEVGIFTLIKLPKYKSLLFFADLLDGAYEDVERLKGIAAEYQYINQANMGILEYRNLLRIEEAPENQKFALIKLVS